MNNRIFLPSVIIFGFVVVLIAGVQFASPIMVVTILMLSMYAVILVGRPAQLLLLAMLFVLFQGTIIALNPPYLHLIDDVFLIIFFALMVGWSVSGKYTKDVIPKESRKIFVPAMICVFISAIIGGKGLSAVKWLPYYYITYFGYIMYFLVSRQVLNEKHIPKIIQFFVGYMVFQYVMNLAYVADVNPIPQIFVRLQADKATGTLYGSLQSAYFALLAGFLFFSLLDNKAIGTTQKRILWGLFGLFMVHNFILTNANHAVLLFAISLFIYLFFIARRKTLKVISTLLLVGMLPLYVGFQSLQFSSANSGLGAWQQMLSVKNVSERWEYSTKSGPKMEVYHKAFVLGLSNMRTYICGVGPVQGLSGKALTVNNPVAMYYVGDVYLTTSGVESLMGGSIMEKPISSLNELMVELGVFGVFFYYLPYFYLLFRISGFYRRGQYSHNQAIIAGTLIPFIILTLIVSTLTQVFQTAYYFATIWLLAALVWDPVFPKGEDLESKGISSEVT